MSLKAELETWAAALKAYDEEDFEKSIQLFGDIADSSKILVNIGLIYATLGEHEEAVKQFNAATELDQFLAVAYFQCGVSNFLLQRFELATKDFETALLYLRGNQDINYEQLGLKFKLYSAEVLFNQALSMLYMGQEEAGLALMEEARKEKATNEHNVIDDAIADRGDGYTVFSIPVGVLYRPSENKLKNAKAKDYMGKAKLVATADDSEAYTSFTGVTRLRQGITPSGVVIDDGPMPAASAGLARAVTVSVTSRPAVADVDRPQPSLQRAKTTITVPPDARERIRALGGSSGSGTPADSSSPVRGPGEGAAGVVAGVAGAAVAGLARSASAGSRGMPPPGAGRSLSVRRPGGSSPTSLNAAAAVGVGSSRSSPTSGPRRNETRLTEFYDDYINSYGEEVPPMPNAQQRSPDRVANWAKNNAQPPLQRSRSTAPSSYAPSSVGGPLRRKTTRRAPPSTYYEEEEGYVSGEYEDAPYEMTKIRVKIHYQDDVRGMALDASLPFEEFVDRLTQKFGKSFMSLGLKFKDEDGGKVSLRDESDYDLAIETAREHAKGKPEGRLEIWCADA